ncbi:MAG: hypothetical protein JO276_17310 [Sphingomonadaceae bacterium]|nr:hypothetical protein [Sphingomonadaceae bacterium]
MADIAPPENPIEALLRIGAGLWQSRALWAAARLRIADVIGDAPRPVAEIAAEIGARPDMLERLLNALVAIGIFVRAGDGSYGHSELSRFLAAGHPMSQRSFVESVFGGEHYESWGEIEASVRTGETGFSRHYGTDVFAYFTANPEIGQLFSEAMTATTRLMEAVLLATYSPPDFTLAVDVGGSQGTLIAGLLGSRPEARGILFDLPDLIERVRPNLGNDRIQAVGGDFFKSVPEADLYLLKLILHDWTDEQSAAILANIRKAIRPGGHVVIIESILPETVQPHPGYFMDLNMMVMTGGRERKASEYGTILERTGFRLERVVPTPTLLSVVEAVAA